MLPQKHRLRQSSDFDRLRHHGSRHRGSYVALNFLPNAYNHSRFGFVVSGKVGNAVTRNRVKRRLRAIIHTHIEAIHPGMDIIIVAHRAAARATYQQLEHEIVGLLKRSGHLLG